MLCRSDANANYRNGREGAEEQKRARFLASVGLSVLRPVDKRWSQLLPLCAAMSVFEIHLVESAWEGIQGLLRRPSSSSSRTFPVEFTAEWACLPISKGLHNSNPSVRKFTITSVLHLGAKLDYATHEALTIDFVAEEVLPALNSPDLYRMSTSADAVTMDEVAIVDRLADFCSAWHSSLPREGGSRATAIQRLLATAPKMDAKIHQMLALFNAISLLDPAPSGHPGIRTEELDLIRTMIVSLHSQLTSHMLRRRAAKLLEAVATCVAKHLYVEENSSQELLDRLCMVYSVIPRSVISIGLFKPLKVLFDRHKVGNGCVEEVYRYKSLLRTAMYVCGNDERYTNRYC